MRFDIVIDVSDDHPALREGTVHDIEFQVKAAVLNNLSDVTVVSVERCKAPDPQAVGSDIKRRRQALGMTVKALAERVGMDRGRLADIERGANARSSTLGALWSALEALEAEGGAQPDHADADNGGVEYQLTAKDGVILSVRGPANEIPNLEASALRLMGVLSET